MKPDVNGDVNNADALLERHLPSAPKEQMDAAGVRVLHRLRAVADRSADRVDEARLGELDLVSVPTRNGGQWARLGAAAAVLLMLAAAMMWQQSTPPAIVDTVDRTPSPSVAEEAPARGGSDTLEIGQTVRTEKAGATATLADGSRVEMRAESELTLERADDGVRIRLKSGSIIVNAAKQPSGHLYVHTNDMTVSVVGTVFLVRVDPAGSRVAVIEGEVRVRGGKTEMRLRPGEQFATSPVLNTRSVKDDITWSDNSRAYLTILDSFARGMTETSAALKSRIDRSSARAAQNQAGQAGTQEFEEASIRLCDPDRLPQAPAGARGGGANSLQMTPGRTNILCMTLATIIRTAYGYSPADLDFMGRGGPEGRGMSVNTVYGLGVEDGVRVRGGPDWVRSDRYTIEAIADPSAGAEAMSRSMLRALLERRFQLKAHIGSEEVPAFSLVVAKGGLKIKPVADDACEPIPPVRTPSDRPRTVAEVRRGEKPTCGLIRSRNGPNMVVLGGRVKLDGLANNLGNNLGGVRVFANTGTTENFNFILEFVIDENAPGRFGEPPQQAAEPSDVPRAPTIFTAIEEQLGLRLERARGAREFIVIDSIARPSPN